MIVLLNLFFFWLEFFRLFLKWRGTKMWSVLTDEAIPILNFSIFYPTNGDTRKSLKVPKFDEFVSVTRWRSFFWVNNWKQIFEDEEIFETLFLIVQLKIGRLPKEIQLIFKHVTDRLVTLPYAGMSRNIILFKHRYV